MTRPRFHTPTSLTQAQALLDEAQNAVLVAGGQWLVPRLSRGDDAAEDLVSTHQLNELRGITLGDDGLTIGAGETHRAIAESADVQRHCALLAQIASQIGDPATRNRGTLGGGLCAAPLQSDYSLALFGLDAVLNTTHRSLPADQFLSGSDRAQFAQNEILISIRFQVSRTGAFEKIANRARNTADAALLVTQLNDQQHRVVIAGERCAPQRQTKIEAKLDAGKNISPRDWSSSDSSLDPFFASQLDALWDQTKTAF